jgi:ribosomal protein L37AE/L43A
MIKYEYHLDPVKHTLTDLRTGEVKQNVKGFPGPNQALRNGHCPKCHMEIVVIGAWACPKCGKF